jgi:dipeptidyl aminopeptidase/acylaminoacyl peptidase
MTAAPVSSRIRRTLKAVLLFASLTFKAFALPVTALAFTPDGTALLSNGDRKVEVRSPKDATIQHSLECDMPKIAALAFNHDGSLLAAGGGEPGVRGEVWLFTWPEGKLKHRVTGHRDLVTSIAFDAANRSLATASADHTAQLWRLAADQPPALSQTLTGHAAPVLAIAFSSPENIVVTASADRSLKVWSTLDGRLLRTLGQHTEAIHALAFKPPDKSSASPAPVTCATGSDDRTVRLWQPETGRMVRIIRQHEAPVFALAWLPDGRAFFSAGKEGIIRRIDGSSDTIQTSWRAHDDWIYALAVSPDGTLLASSDWSGAVRIHNIPAHPVGSAK